MNSWTFAGRVSTAEKKTTQGGKSYWKATLIAKPAKEGGKPSAVAFTYWGEHFPGVGAPCIASGMFSSWQGKEGETRMEMVAFEAYPVATAQGADHHERRGYDRYQPVAPPQPPPPAETHTPVSDIPF